MMRWRLFVVVMSLFVYGVVLSQEVYLEEEGLYSTRQLTLQAEVNIGATVVIESASTLTGTLTVVTNELNEIRIVYFKKARCNSRSRAIDYVDLMAVDIDRNGGNNRIQFRAPNPAPWKGSETGIIDAEITVPEGTHLTINATYFDVNADGPFSGVVIPSSLGRLNVSGVTGTVNLSTSNRRITVSDIVGKLILKTSNSTLSARGIRTERGRASFRNDGGDIIVEDIVGEVSARNRFGRIEITQFEPRGDKNFIRGQSGPILVDIVRLERGQVVVNNKFEDIELVLPENLSAELSLSVEEDGKIEVTNMLFLADLVQYNRLSLKAGDGDAIISSSISGNGNIFIRGRNEGL